MPTAPRTRSHGSPAALGGARSTSSRSAMASTSASLLPDPAVERDRGHAEACRHAPHADGVEAGLLEDLDRRGHDLLGVEVEVGVPWSSGHGTITSLPITLRSAMAGAAAASSSNGILAVTALRSRPSATRAGQAGVDVLELLAAVAAGEHAEERGVGHDQLRGRTDSATPRWRTRRTAGGRCGPVRRRRPRPATLRPGRRPRRRPARRSAPAVPVRSARPGGSRWPPRPASGRRPPAPRRSPRR